MKKFITHEYSEEVLNKLKATYALAKEVYGQEFVFPRVFYKDMGKTAGRAHYALNCITLSETLLSENKEVFLGRTVPHEAAHLICHVMYPHAMQHHGPEWRSVMSALGVKDSTRCHAYDTSSVERKRTRRNRKCNIYSRGGMPLRDYLISKGWACA